MNVGDILDQAFTFYRKSFLTLIGIVAVVSVPVAIVQILGGLLAGSRLTAILASGGSAAASVPPSQTPTLLLGSALLGIAYLLGLAGSILQSGALAVVVSERFLGRSVNLRQAYARTLGRWRALLAMALVLALVYGLLFGVLVIPFLLLLGMGIFEPSLASGPVANAALGAVFCLFCGFWPVLLVVYLALQIRWLFAPQAIVVENCGGLDGLRRSWRLVRGSFWRVLGINLVLTVLVSLISATPAFAIQMAVSLLPSFLLETVINNAVGTVINIVALPLQFAVLTLLYYDLRMRKEGFDLELLARQQLAASLASLATP